MKSDKIISFQKNSDFYYNLAVDSIYDGNHCSALEYLRRAIDIEPECIDYKLLIAEVYFDMELFEYSNNEYFKVLRRETNPECYFGLGQNYIYLDEYAYALGYFKKCLEYSGLDEDDIEFAEDIIDRLNEGDKDYGEKRNYTPLINWARSLLKSGDPEYAIQLLKFVPEKSPAYTEASNYLALSYHMSDKPQHATDKIEEILKKDPVNIFALCTYISVANAQKNYQLRDSLAARVLKLKCDDVSGLFKIATALCDIKDHKNAVKYLEKVLLYKPYDLTTLMLIAIAYYNNNNGQKAKIFLNRLIKIDGGNSIAKYYNILMNEKKRKYSVLEYNCQVPYNEGVRRVRRLEDATRLPLDRLDRLYKTDKELGELIIWSLTLQDSALINSIFNKIVFCPSFLDDARDMITNVFVNNYLKKQLIKNLCFQKIKKFDILVEADLKKINMTYPKELDVFPPVFKKAYSNVISTLCFMESGFERKLAGVMKRILVRAETVNMKLKNEEALSAVIAKEYGIFYESFDNLCEVFDARAGTVNAYCGMLGIPKGQKNRVNDTPPVKKVKSRKTEIENSKMKNI